MRELRWRKIGGEAIWHSKPFTSHQLPPMRLEVVAGVRHSSVCNRNAVVRVQLPINGRKYNTVCEQEFYTGWHAKIAIDSLLFLLRNRACKDPQENYEWFINELNSLKTPEVEPPTTNSWATIAGYSV